MVCVRECAWCSGAVRMQFGNAVMQYDQICLHYSYSHARPGYTVTHLLLCLRHCQL